MISKCNCAPSEPTIASAFYQQPIPPCTELKYPKIIEFRTDRSTILKGNSITLDWSIESENACADEFFISTEEMSIVNGSLTNRGRQVGKHDSITEMPEKDTTYVLTALRSLGNRGSIICMDDVIVRVKDMEIMAGLQEIRLNDTNNPIEDDGNNSNIKSNQETSFTISNLADGDQAAKVITLIGEYPVEFEDDIWLFVVAPNGYYYPQSIKPCDKSWRTPKEKGKWEMWAGLGMPGDVGEFFDIVITTANKNGSQNISTDLERWCTSNYYPGWTKLPHDIQEGKRITVIRNSDLWGLAPSITNTNITGEVSFININNSDRVPHSMNLLGNHSNRLGGKIWVLVYASNGRWYPQSMDACRGIHINDLGQKWEVPVIFGSENGNIGEAFDVVTVLATDNASEFLDIKQREWCKSGDYPGLLTIDLPQGIEEKDRVRVYRRAEPSPIISNSSITGDISFSNVADKQDVPWRMNLLGNCSSRLGGKIWVLVYAPNGRWYPQSMDACKGLHVSRNSQRWEVPVIFGSEYGNVGDAFDIVAVLANDNASEFLDAKQREWCKASDYPGLLTTDLPEGIEEKDRARVYRSADRWGLAPNVSNANLTGDVSFANVFADSFLTALFK
jgi:hypothetical protein